MHQILLIFTVICWSLPLAAAEVPAERALDKKVLSACASNPKAATYLYVADLFGRDPAAKEFITGITLERVKQKDDQGMYGLVQLGVGCLLESKAISDAEVRLFSLRVIAKSDRQKVYFGEAKPAFAWLSQQDTARMGLAELAAVQPLFTHPLILSLVMPSITDETLSAALNSKEFPKMVPEFKIAVVETSITKKLIDPATPAMETLLRALAADSIDGKITWFTYTRTRDEALMTAYAKTVEDLVKAKDDPMLFVLVTQASDLLARLDVQQLHVDEAAKLRLLRLKAGKPLGPNDE